MSSLEQVARMGDEPLDALRRQPGQGPLHVQLDPGFDVDPVPLRPLGGVRQAVGPGDDGTRHSAAGGGGSRAPATTRRPAAAGPCTRAGCRGPS